MPWTWRRRLPLSICFPTWARRIRTGRRINENGDILGVFKNASGSVRAYLYDPGIYDGDPELRALRDGIPLDLHNESPIALPLNGGGSFELNNPIESRPMQVAGRDSNGVAFRYTMGTQPVYEDFPEFDLWNVSGLNDLGTFCGGAWVRIGTNGKAQETLRPYRLNVSLDVLQSGTSADSAGDINNAGDIIAYSHVYQDVSGWRHARDLPVVGSDVDLALWFDPQFRADLSRLSDRVTADDAGYIVGRTNFTPCPLFLLTPTPVP